MKILHYLALTSLLLLGCKDDNNLILCCPSEPMILTFSNNVIAFPNAYTPNGNGINETYQPYLKLDYPTVIKSFEFRVIRDGRTVYSESNSMSSFQFFNQQTELLELTYQIITDQQTFNGTIDFISLASECFTIEPSYFLPDQFDANQLEYREFTSEVSCN